jgi:hypothetical protein
MEPPRCFRSRLRYRADDGCADATELYADECVLLAEKADVHLRNNVKDRRDTNVRSLKTIPSRRSSLVVYRWAQWEAKMIIETKLALQEEAD